jgi:hypothetical protein
MTSLPVCPFGNSFEGQLCFVFSAWNSSSVTKPGLTPRPAPAQEGERVTSADHGLCWRPEDHEFNIPMRFLIAVDFEQPAVGAWRKEQSAREVQHDLNLAPERIRREKEAWDVRLFDFGQLLDTQGLQFA